MRIPKQMMPHGGLVEYRNPAGHGGHGATLMDPVVPERANIQEKRRLVRGSASEIVSTAQVWLDPEETVAEGAQVTIWKGTARERTSTALAVAFWDQGPGLPAHVEVYCT